ncbi:MAG: type II secretion system F family protein [Bdellovibrionota bacterium]
MPTFLWEGRTSNGGTVKGKTEGPNQEAVINLLESQNIRVQSIKAGARELKLPAFLQPGVDQKTVVIFTRQFATMIDAGLPLVQCLDILANQQDNPTFKKTLYAVKNGVEAGKTFADSLKEHPKVFDDLYANMVAAGEVGGILDTILNRLATAMEKVLKLKKQVKGAMVYPISVLVVAVGVVILLMVKVIPVFADLFSQFGNELPPPTKFVMDVSDWFVANIWYILATCVAVPTGFKSAYSTPRGRDIIDKYMLKIPAIGNVIRKVAVARFTRTLGTMLSSGVPIMEALEVTARTAGNTTVQKEIMKCRLAVSEGKSLTEPLQKSVVFPSMVVQMIQVGESTGAMDAMLTKIADFYDEEVDAAVEAMTSLLEPIIIVFLGGTIGGILIAMYMPIFDLAGNIGG